MIDTLVQSDVFTFNIDRIVLSKAVTDLSDSFASYATVLFFLLPEEVARSRNHVIIDSVLLYLRTYFDVSAETDLVPTCRRKVARMYTYNSGLNNRAMNVRIGSVQLI